MKKLFLSTFILAPLLTISCAHLKDQNPPEKTNNTEAPSKPSNTPSVKVDSPLQPRGLDYGATIKLVAFGASANQNAPQPIWKPLLEHKPDIFLFMGDTIQAAKTEQKPLSVQFRRLNNIPEYRNFREKIPFLVTWDDLDYGQEKGGADFSGKDLSKKDFLRNWTYIRDSIAMGQPGIYHAKIIGPKKKLVQFIMLDTRSFRSPPSQDANSKTTILGEDQWSWLEAQLKRPAQMRFIVTSIPLIASEHEGEKWANFPHEQQRFFDLLKKTRARNVLVLSGDQRQGTIAKTSLKDWGTLYDITASPINEPRETALTDSAFDGKAFNVENFGLAKIDWAGKRVQVELRDKENQVLHSTSFKLQ